MEYAFLELEVEVVVARDLEDVGNGSYMGRPYFFGGTCDLCGDSDVVHVYTDKRTQGFVPGYGSAVSVVHERLKRGGRVAEAKHHNTRLVETSARLECRLVSVGLLDPDVIVSLPHVELGVESCAAQIANEVTDEW